MTKPGLTGAAACGVRRREEAGMGRPRQAHVSALLMRPQSLRSITPGVRWRVREPLLLLLHRHLLGAGSESGGGCPLCRLWRQPPLPLASLQHPSTPFAPACRWPTIPI
jgi:hypothetical protein